MEELQMIVEMVSKLPQLALWVLIGLFAYKIAVVGSIYGVIRFAIDKTHSWLTKPKDVACNVRLMLDGEVLSGSREALMAQIQRIKRATGSYVHQSDVDWLRDAISEKLEREAKRP